MNFSNLDAPYNAQYYVPGDKDTEIAYMGCVQGSEVVTYKIGDDLYVEGIESAFNRLSCLGVQHYGMSEYIDLTGKNVTIYDSYSKGFVNVKKWIKNPNKNNWNLLKLSNGRSLVATADHPLPVKFKGRTYVKDVKPGDSLYVSDNQFKVDEGFSEPRLAGVISVEPIHLDECSFDVETESDRFDVSGILSHNCRTRVMANVYNPEYEKVTGRGNLSFTSINLPRLGIRSNGNIDKFFELLDGMMSLVHKQLLARFEVQCRKHPRNYPFLMGQGIWINTDDLGPDDDIREVLKNGTLTVGFIGLAECLVTLTGKHHGESAESQELGLKIVKHMRDLTDKWSQDEKMNYSVIATPRWGTCDCIAA